MKQTLKEIDYMYDWGKNEIDYTFTSILAAPTTKEFIDTLYNSILNMYCHDRNRWWKTMIYKCYILKKHKSLLRYYNNILKKLTKEFVSYCEKYDEEQGGWKND